MSIKESKWFIKEFHALSNEELYDILSLRSQVFIVEQFCPYQDPDGTDKNELHLFCKEAGNIMAYARIIKPGVHYPEASIGRIITSPSARGKGYGSTLMKKSIEAVQSHYSESDIKIGAQCYLEKFYMKFGFEKVGEMYLEDGIPHYKMLRISPSTY